MAQLTVHLPTAAETWDPVEPVRFADRFQVLREAGRGGGGQVFAALDLHSGQPVALKLIHHPMDRRTEREIAALRALDLPGVVALREVLEHEGHPLLVMDLVDGHPFPGPELPSLPSEPSGPSEPSSPNARWNSLRPTLVSLLETLGRVHEAGIVHRDLKPGNVLVAPDGSAMLLDFGLARGRMLGSTITRRGTVVGTPRYLAPELLTGYPADGRSDLYAVGVMVYEALAGHAPHPSDDLGPLILARLNTPAPSLAHPCPDLPRAVVELVDSLLQRDPLRRPPSTRAVLDLLGQGERDEQGEALPWLGSDEPIEALVAAAQQRTAAAAVGLPGSGRSRALREAARRLQAMGQTVYSLVPAARPFESLRPHLEVEQIRVDPAAALRELLQRGVVLADDRSRLDRWTRAALELAEGPVLWGATPVELDGLNVQRVPLPRLTVSQLQPLFHGPDRFLHLREDGAAALHRRSLGLPARVESVLTLWVQQGIARWEERRIRITRGALDRLSAEEHERFVPDVELRLEPDLAAALMWILLAGADVDAAVLAQARGLPDWEHELVLAELERAGALARDGERLLPLARPEAELPWTEERRALAHSALARALSSGSPARLRHLLAAQHLALVGPEALILARSLWREGRSSQARALLSLAGEAMATQDPSAVLPLACLQLRLALAEGTSLALSHAESLVHTAGSDPVLDRLLEAARRPSSERFDALLRLGPLPDEDTEICRAALLVQCGRAGGAPRRAELEEFLGAWALAATHPEADALREGWRGLMAYAEGRFEEAAVAHSRSLEGKDGLVGRLSSLLNLASSRMEQGELEAAVGHALEAFELAVRHRQPLYEARALLIERRARERLGERLEPDPTLVDEAAMIGSPVVAGLLSLAEAYIARRATRPELARKLAAQAEDWLDAAGNPDGALIARALRAGQGEPGAWGAPERSRASAARATVRDELDKLLGGLAASSGED